MWTTNQLDASYVNLRIQIKDGSHHAILLAIEEHAKQLQTLKGIIDEIVTHHRNEAY